MANDIWGSTCYFNRSGLHFRYTRALVWIRLEPTCPHLSNSSSINSGSISWQVPEIADGPLQSTAATHHYFSMVDGAWGPDWSLHNSMAPGHRDRKSKQSVPNDG